MQRQTKQRAAIQAAFQTLARPIGPAEILEEAQVAVPAMGLSTVYRAITAMVEEGVITPVELPGEPPRYELSETAQQHHHHFVCDGCQRVFDVFGCPGGMKDMLPEGFALREHEILLRGRCDLCA